jgi:AcrR family transcriptional regulator
MLDAAQAVVLKQGAASLTLDAVAREAQVSKGGVMYHFPTKQALLTALGERMIARNQSRHAEIFSALPPTPGRELKAYVHNSTREVDVDDRVSTALLAVVNGAPSLMDAGREYFNQRFRKLTAGVPFEQAGLVYLATEGLWLLEMLQISPLSAAQRAVMVQRLLVLSEPGQELEPKAAASPKRRRMAKVASANKTLNTTAARRTRA